MLADRLKNYKAIICEVEDPTDNSDKSYESLRKRRINFYERNSYKTTSLKCDMCGMILNVMYRSDTEIEEEEIFHAIENIYDTTLTKNLAEKIMVFKS